MGSVKEEKHEGASLRPEDHTLRPLDVPTCCEIEVLMLIVELKCRTLNGAKCSSETLLVIASE